MNIIDIVIVYSLANAAPKYSSRGLGPSTATERGPARKHVSEPILYRIPLVLRLDLREPSSTAAKTSLLLRPFLRVAALALLRFLGSGE